MIDTNEDADLMESFKYLLLSKEEKIRISGKPFDGKKQCWVPDPKDCYVSAQIETEEENILTVLTTKNEVT
jgi:hypothetical protein